MTFEITHIAGVGCASASQREIATWIVDKCEQGPLLPHVVCSLNGQGIASLGARDYDTALQSADLVHADGMSVVFASRFLGGASIPERSATTDMVHDVAGLANARGLSFYLLGGKKGVASEAAQVLRATYPGLSIVGAEDGYFRDDDTDALCARIRDSGADILWLGLGRPLQEIWAHEHRADLAGVGVIKTCGGLFDHLSGRVRRAPLWMQKAGLEWLWRFTLEPRRLAYRSFVGNALSVWRMLTVRGPRGDVARTRHDSDEGEQQNRVVEICDILVKNQQAEIKQVAAQQRDVQVGQGSAQWLAQASQQAKHGRY